MKNFYKLSALLAILIGLTAAAPVPLANKGYFNIPGSISSPAGDINAGTRGIYSYYSSGNYVYIVPGQFGVDFKTAGTPFVFNYGNKYGFTVGSGTSNTNWFQVIGNANIGCADGTAAPTNGIITCGLTQTPAIQSTGTTFTISGCGTTGLKGGSTAGEFNSGTSGTCTITITFGGLTATNGWYCSPANDLTTPADHLYQTARTTTTATMSGTTVTGDLINFSCNNGY